MTKVGDKVNKNTGDPIRFKQFFDPKLLEFVAPHNIPSDFDWIERIDYLEELDLSLIRAYDEGDDESMKSLYLGHWNGGWVDE